MYTRGGPKLHLTLAGGATLLLLLAKYQQQELPADRPGPQPREPEPHFDQRAPLPDPGATAAPRPSSPVTSALGSRPSPSATPEHPLHPGRQRWLQLARLQTPLRAGLCSDPSAASDAQDRLRFSFRELSWGDTARLYIDPRLPTAVDPAMLQALERVERALGSALGPLPARPDVFGYFDRERLQECSCVDAAVSAFYDGALHAVLTQREMLQSLLRQYARHALVSRGLIGQSWEREGIALDIAGESWWQERSWLMRIANTPLELDALEQELPDTTNKGRAQLFYAHAAAMFRCATRQLRDGLTGLVAALDVQQARGELSYRLPSSAEPVQLRSCVADLLH